MDDLEEMWPCQRGERALAEPHSLPADRLQPIVAQTHLYVAAVRAGALARSSGAADRARTATMGRPRGGPPPRVPEDPADRAPQDCADRRPSHRALRSTFGATVGDVGLAGLFEAVLDDLLGRGLPELLVGG